VCVLLPTSSKGTPKELITVQKDYTYIYLFHADKVKGLGWINIAGGGEGGRWESRTLVQRTMLGGGGGGSINYHWQLLPSFGSLPKMYTLSEHPCY
jgi:hypothetical protein